MVNEQPWSIEFYADERGRQPVAEFIRELPSKLRSKLSWSLELLEAYGDRLPMPHSRPITGQRFYELRSQSGRDSVRIFYFITSDRRIVMLHGFAKKTRQTPRRELQIAAGRRDDVLRRL